MRRALSFGLLTLAVMTAGSATATIPAPHPKRGVASARYLASAPSQLAPLHADWSYDWSATAPPHPRAVGWVPMVWGSGSVTPGTIASLRADGRTGLARYLLGFNEPDMSSQSNLTPGRAAALWPRLERTGLILGSPAPAVPTDGWLARFMALVQRRQLRVSFIALHYYQDFTDPQSVSELRQQLLVIHHTYRRPIWITELGAMDIRAWGEPMLHRPTEPRAARYMRRLFAMLDALPFVQRYAWFTDNCSSDPACRFSSLFDSRGRLTPAGSTFRTAR